MKDKHRNILILVLLIFGLWLILRTGGDSMKDISKEYEKKIEKVLQKNTELREDITKLKHTSYILNQKLSDSQQNTANFQKKIDNIKKITDNINPILESETVSAEKYNYDISILKEQIFQYEKKCSSLELSLKLVTQDRDNWKSIAEKEREMGISKDEALRLARESAIKMIKVNKKRRRIEKIKIGATAVIIALILKMVN